MKPGRKGVARIIAAAGFSWQGLLAAFRHEAAFRQEILLTIILVPVAFWLSENGTEMALLTGSVFLVLIVEVLNSAIEAVVDRLGSEYHELSKRAKDMGSAAVFLAMINVLFVWLFIIVF